MQLGCSLLLGFSVIMAATTSSGSRFRPSCDRAFYAAVFRVPSDAPIIDRFLRYNELHRRIVAEADPSQRFVVISIDTTEDGPNDGGIVAYSFPECQFTPRVVWQRRSGNG